MLGIQPGSPGCNVRVLPRPQTLVLEEGDFDKMPFISSNFTNPSLPKIEMIDIGHKSLPIIIGPLQFVHTLPFLSFECFHRRTQLEEPLQF